MRKFYSIIIVLLFSLAASAYTVAPSCPDFTDINASYSVATTGSTSNPFANTGVVSGRHSIITAQGTDPNTGGALSLLPAGESRVIKLGNDRVGYEAETVTCHFMVDKDRPVLLLKFAVVFEDPAHNVVIQPRFVVRITDKDGNLIEDCAEYDVSAGADLEGFQTYNKGYYSPIRWRNWTNVGLDMSRYIGKEVQVQFVTYDCAAGGHFGYAYFTAHCIPNILQLENCGGGNYTVEAPDNFASYLWDNGDQTRTSTRSAAETNKTLTCLVTSVTGCRFPLYAYVTNSAPSVPSVYKDTVCEGETYSKHNFNLHTQFETGEKQYYNTYLNPTTCNGNVTDELILTVLPRYERIEATICQGEDYKANGFEILQPAAGVRYDTIKISSAGAGGKCDRFRYLKLTVNVSLNMPNVIQGDHAPCVNEPVVYEFAGAETMTKYSWAFPANAVVLKGRYSSQVTLYFTDDTPAQVILKGENGCGTGAVSFDVTPCPTYNQRFTDNICTGESYNNYGFNLGVQNTAGYFVHEKKLTTKLGCDSTVMLALQVNPIPTVRIEPIDPVLCYPGDEITLYALDENEAMPQFVFYDLSDGTYMIQDYYGIFERIVIPSYYSGKKVTGIDHQAFQNKNIKEVIIPSTVTFIGDGAFRYSSSLLYITIPASVTELGFAPFAGCPNLTIRCYEGSVIHQYAEQVGFPFELIEEFPSAYIYDCNINYLWNTGDTSPKITQRPAETTTYTVMKTSAGGCSSSASMTVLVKTLTPSVINDTICEGGVYNNFGFTETETGTYTHTVTQAGCDIEATLNLVVNPVYRETVTGTTCYGIPYTEHGLNLTFYKEGLVCDTLHYLRQTGCDSTVILNIQVKPVGETILKDVVCQYETYNKNGFNLSAQEIAGEKDYTRKITTPQGCDSTVTLRLTIKPVYTTLISDEDTIGAHYRRYGFDKVLTEIVPYGDTLHLQSTDGCDSTVILNLKVLCLAKDTVVYDSVCAGGDYFGYGFVLPKVFADTILIDSLQTIAGCDSVVILNLTVIIAPAVSVESFEVCQNDNIHLIFTGVAPFVLEYTFNSKRQIITVNALDTLLTATQVGENMFLPHSLTDGNGCSANIDEGVEIDGVLWATRNVGAPYSFAGTPSDYGMLYQWNKNVGWTNSDPMTNSNGGNIWDTSYTVPSDSKWKYANDPSPNGWRVPNIDEMQKLLDVSGTYTYLNGIYGSLFGTAPNQIFMPLVNSREGNAGVLYNSAFSSPFGSRYWTRESGCLILAFTDDAQRSNYNIKFAFGIRPVKRAVIVNPVYASAIDTTICENNLPFIFCDSVFTEAGLKDVHFQTVAGCDSVITVNLFVVQQPPLTIIKDTICEGENYTDYNFNLTSPTAGTYKDTIVNIYGCDSIIQLELFVRTTPTVEFVSPYEFCIGDSVRIHFTGTSPFVLDYKINNTAQPQITVYGTDTAFVQNTAGVYDYEITSLTDAYGCSALLVSYQQYTVYAPSGTIIRDTICYGEEYHRNGFDITSPVTDTYTQSHKNINGCDSTVTLELFVASLPEVAIIPT
ncbi:MAG: leucine-rich repeat domain-containing protein, partial [Prevotellaceae bacterium]|nr:leucine-rich repeat domain-containing protein [Prevotellaceae bacterium]